MNLATIYEDILLNSVMLCSLIGCSADNDGDNAGKAENVPPINPITSFVASGSTLYTTAGNYGVFQSQNAGDSWERIGLYGVSTLALLETALYAANGHIER